MNTKRSWSPTPNKKLVQLSIVQAMSTNSSNQPNKHQCSMTIFELWVLSLNVQLLSLTRGGDGNAVVVKIVVKMNREVEHTSYKTSCILALWWWWCYSSILVRYDNIRFLIEMWQLDKPNICHRWWWIQTIYLMVGLLCVAMAEFQWKNKN
jgi:hypothetical protein